jgi:hypothetical protein
MARGSNGPHTPKRRFPEQIAGDHNALCQDLQKAHFFGGG